MRIYAERTLTRLRSQRDARTRVTVNQLVDKYFALTRVRPNTKENYESLAIRLLLGDVSLAKINGEMLDSFYNLLRKCRVHTSSTISFVESKWRSGRLDREALAAA